MKKMLLEAMVSIFFSISLLLFLDVVVGVQPRLLDILFFGFMANIIIFRGLK